MRKVICLTIVLSLLAAAEGLAFQKDVSAVPFAGRPFKTGLNLPPGLFNISGDYWGGKDMSSYGANAAYGLTESLSAGVNAGMVTPDEGDDGIKIGGSVAYNVYKNGAFSAHAVADTTAVMFDNFDGYSVGAYATCSYSWFDAAERSCIMAIEEIWDTLVFWCGLGSMYEMYEFDMPGADNETDLDIGGAAGLQMGRGPVYVGAEGGYFDEMYWQVSLGVRFAR